jgi:divalent metal cation (Fe/Co/Zn/Cd) transporter
MIVETARYVLFGIFVLCIVCGFTLKWYFARARVWIRAKQQKHLDSVEHYELELLELSHKRISGSFSLFGLCGIIANLFDKWPWSPLFAGLVVTIMLVATKRP